MPKPEGLFLVPPKSSMRCQPLGSSPGPQNRWIIVGRGEQAEQALLDAGQAGQVLELRTQQAANREVQPETAACNTNERAGSLEPTIWAAASSVMSQQGSRP